MDFKSALAMVAFFALLSVATLFAGVAAAAATLSRHPRATFFVVLAVALFYWRTKR